jgi:hypothetical protein
MTRTEAIAAINSKLAALDDERVLTLAEIVDDISRDIDIVRPLTAREMSLLEQAREDFACGRTHSVEDVRAHSDQLIRSLRIKHSKTP